MKILISGKDSYIGGHIKKRLENDGHYVEELDVKDERYKQLDFSRFDSIVHVAAIVHQKQTKNSWNIYEKVNVNLPFYIAKKAKESGVKHFIFISSMAVYGQSKKIPNGNIINIDTPTNPIDYYGKSKLLAEKKLETLKGDNFCLTFVRPPNVYGPSSPGNYFYRYARLVKIFPFFPIAYMNSFNSYININNLSELIKLILYNKSGGIFTPQDSEQTNTLQLLEMIKEINGNKIIFSKFLGLLIQPFSFLSIIKKIYGGVSYDPNMSNHFNGMYQVVNFNKGIEHMLKEEKYG